MVYFDLLWNSVLILSTSPLQSLPYLYAMGFVSAFMLVCMSTCFLSLSDCSETLLSSAVQRPQMRRCIAGDMTVQCYYYTHYSSAIIVASYLVRMPPFTQAFCSLQVSHCAVFLNARRSIRKPQMSICKPQMSIRKPQAGVMVVLPL